MSDPNWYGQIAAGAALSAAGMRALQEDGFAVISGPVAQGDLQQLAKAYDKAMIEADPADIGHGSTTIRVHDFVNRSPEFDGLYIHAPLLEACCHTIARPFKLSLLPGKGEIRQRGKRLYFFRDGSGRRAS